MVEKYWARLIPDEVAQRAQVVFATDYDALAASRDERSAQLIEAQRRNVALAAELAELKKHVPLKGGVPLKQFLAERRIRELEAALRKKGHAPNCDLDPCDCGLDAVLTPAKTAEPTGTDSKCPHGHWKAYCDLCLLATAETEAKHD